MSKPILYSYFRSSASWRVRIALAIKDIDYDYRPVHLIKSQQNAEEYVNLNPMQQVPTLVIDGLTLTQSLPIIEYLEETRPGKNLLPKDPAKRVHARRLAEIVNAGIQPLQNLPVMNKIAEWCGGSEKKLEWCSFWITRGFHALEKELQATAGRFCVGDEITIADLALVPQVYNANRFKVDMKQFPTIVRIRDELVKEDCFKKADPLNQPDTPEEMKQ